MLRRRRLVAALLLGGAAAVGVRALAPPPPVTATVLVAVRDLPAGRVLERGDLTTARMPPDAVPHRVAEDPLGRRLAAPVAAGEPVTDVRLVGAALGTAQPPGTVAVPVRLSDAGQVALLSPGDRISLLSTDTQVRATRMLAREATVLAVPDAAAAADGALPGRLVVLALDSDALYQVTQASAAEYVTYTWSRR